MNKILQTLAEGFTYEGSVKHSIINYTLIIITVLPHMITRNQVRENRHSWYWVLITSVFVQVLIWFSLNATGVSVIWSSVAGFNLIRFGTSVSHLNKTTKVLFVISFIMVLLGMLYYFMVLPPITTIAHIMAFLMGILLFYLYRNLHSRYRLR